MSPTLRNPDLSNIFILFVKIMVVTSTSFQFIDGFFAGKDGEKDKDNSDSLMKKDSWNLSNDHFYDPKQSTVNPLAVGLMSAVLQVSRTFFQASNSPYCTIILKEIFRLMLLLCGFSSFKGA